MRAIVFDTETTGLVQPDLVALDKQPRIIELGLIIVEDGEVKEDFNWLINHGEEVTAEITKITGITTEMLAGKPTFEEVWNEFARDLFNGCDVSIAHNHPFDKAMIDNEVRRLTGEPFGCGWPATQICTVQEFTHEFGKRPKLVDLYERYMGIPLAQTHRASDDAKALVEVLQSMKFFDSL